MHESDREYRAIITSGRWRALRNWKLAQSPLCEECKRQGFIRPACEVHHKTPISSAIGLANKQALAFDTENLMSVCHACHTMLHQLAGKQTAGFYEERKEKRLTELVGKWL